MTPGTQVQDVPGLTGPKIMVSISFSASWICHSGDSAFKLCDLIIQVVAAVTANW